MEDARDAFLQLCDQDPGLLPEIERSLSQLAVFENLPPGDLQEILATVEPFLVQPGEVLFDQDSLGDTLFMVLEGKILLTGRNKDGSARLVGVRARGDCFGEISFLTRAPRSLAAINSETEALVLAFRHGTFRELIGRTPRIGFAVYENLVRSIQERLEPLPAFFRNLVIWGYAPPAPDEPEAETVEDPRLSMAAILGLAGLAVGVLQFSVFGFAMKRANPELFAGLGLLNQGILMVTMPLLSAAAAFAVGVHYDKLEAQLIWKQPHSRCCAQCKFVLYDEASGRNQCLFASHPDLRTRFKPGLRPETYTDCPSFEFSPTHTTVKARQRDPLGND